MTLRTRGGAAPTPRLGWRDPRDLGEIEPLDHQGPVACGQPSSQHPELLTATQEGPAAGAFASHCQRCLSRAPPRFEPAICLRVAEEAVLTPPDGELREARGRKPFPEVEHPRGVLATELAAGAPVEQPRAEFVDVPVADPAKLLGLAEPL